VFMNRSMDIIMPDVTIVGGILELKKISDMAEAWNIATAPHGPFGPVVNAAGVQTMSASPGFLILEYAWGEVPWRADLITPSEEIINGKMSITNRPGLGIELNPEVVTQHRVHI
jgi:galactonate dehydratase